MSAYVFPSAYKGGRPVRLCEATRRFAMESLLGKYGAQTISVPFVSADGVQGWENMSEHERYAAGLDLVVKECPVRICPAERVCGAATLGLAVRHQVPMVRGGQMHWPVSSSQRRPLQSQAVGAGTAPGQKARWWPWGH